MNDFPSKNDLRRFAWQALISDRRPHFNDMNRLCSVVPPVVCRRLRREMDDIQRAAAADGTAYLLNHN